METKETQVKISYFRDYENDPNRVLCIARKFDKPNKTVTFAYCVNHPTEWKIVLEGKKLQGKISSILTEKEKEQGKKPQEFVVDGKNVTIFVKEKGDSFCKAEAHRMAMKERLLQNLGITIPVPDDKKPIRACLEWLISSSVKDGVWTVNEPNNKVRTLVENVLIDFDFQR